MGAWLPIVCGRMIGRESVVEWLDLSPHDVSVMHLAALIPPLLIATVFTAAASRWPRSVQRNRDWFGILMVVLLIFSYGSQYTMTDAQRSYLETLCRDTGEQFDETLSKAEASKRIDELRERSPRLTQE